MNSGSSPVESALKPAAQPGFRQQLAGWHDLLVRCGRKPGRKCVHALRVATLRMQAELEYGLRAQPAETQGFKAARRLRRQGKKLRRALGPVRQADVYLGKLNRVRGWAGTRANGHPTCPKTCLSAIDQLARSFERQRGDAAKHLAAEIKQRRKRLGRLGKKAGPELETFARTAESRAASKILQQLEATDEQFSNLDAGNLHEFRKQIKKVRYLAEIFGRADESALRQADTLRRMTGAVGEWHDWQALAQEARQAAGEWGAMKALADCLEAQASRSLDHALGACRRSMNRLLRRRADGAGADGTAPSTKAPDETLESTDFRPNARKPVASVSAEPRSIVPERSLRAS